MKRHQLWILFLALILIVALPAAAREVSESNTLQRSIELSQPGRASTLIVDNVFGAITVTGYGGRTIEVVVEETYEARSPAALERARREVGLEIRERNNVVELYVGGPFREERNRHRGYNWNDYVVTYDFEIKVPYETQLNLITVNNGDIRVTDVQGDFDVDNVNGDIELRGLAGSGQAHTVNGPVRVWFAENPREDSSFKTVNGNLEVHFQPGLSADLSMKTFNGEFWSAFEVEPLAANPQLSEKKKDGKWIVTSRAWTQVRAGRGGPNFTFETLNGDVLIRRYR